jgi:hypothetical protein
MLGAANNAAIRSAIGLGQTDAPTFNSLGVTNTATANVFSTSAAALQTAGYLGVARAINLIDTAGISWSSTSTLLGATGTNLLQDAAGILAQRNLGTAQIFRVYNSTDATPATNYDRASFGFTSNALRIGTENGGTYTTARPIQFVIGGTACATISSLGLVSISGALAGTFDNVLTLPGGVEFRKDGATTLVNVAFTGGSQLYISNNSFKFGSAGMIGFTSASGISNVFDAAFARNAPGVIEVNTGTAGTFGFLKAKLQTSTAYTATVVAATGYITLYDSTGTAYRVPCAV